MSNSVGEKRGLQTYSERLDRTQRRLFNPAIPAGVIVNLCADIHLEARRLDRKEEEPLTLGSSPWFREFCKKDQIRRELEKLRASVTRIAEPERGPESEGTLAGPTLVDRFSGLSQLLETDPSAAASTVVEGITDPNTHHPWRRLLVIAAEGIRFTDEQDREILPALLEFIVGFRDSNDREDQIAVCSAIRTYVGLTPTAQIASVAALLEPGHRAGPSLDTLLETVKMIARKFAATPPATPNEHPVLSRELERLAGAYSNPHVLPHGKNAALAMNSVQAVAALASPGIHGLIAEVNTCCPPWFRQQLQRRLRNLLKQWDAKLGDRAADHEPTNLVQEAIDRLQTV